MPKSRSRHPSYKLHIGWLHHQKGKYRQVTGKKGGGTRIFEFKKEEAQSVDSLIDLGRKLFFHDGKSHFGPYASMKVALSNHDGEEIKSFCDQDGRPCTFLEYVKSQGLYSSQSYMYLRTATIDTHHTDPQTGVVEPGFLVDGKAPEQIKIRYTRETQSLYCSNKQQLNVYSMKDCYNVDEHQSLDLKDYNPFLDGGFTMTFVAINNQIYYEVNEEHTAVYSQGDTLGSDVIVYSPQELHGYEESSGEEKQLILAVVTNQPEKEICWYKDNKPFASGKALCAIHIQEPGKYTVGVTRGQDVHLIDPPVDVTLLASTVSANMEVTNLGALDNPATLDIQSTVPANMEVTNHGALHHPATLDIPNTSSTNSEVTNHGSLNHPATLGIPSTASANMEVTKHGALDNSTTLDIQNTVSANMEVTNHGAMHHPATLDIPNTFSTNSEVTNHGTLNHPAILGIPNTASANMEVINHGALYHPATLDIPSTASADIEVTNHGALPHSATLDIPNTVSANMEVANHSALPHPVATLTTTSTSCTSSQPSLSVPKISLSDVSVKEEIGRGAFGIVHRGEWIGTTVAVKEITVRRMKFARAMIERELSIHSGIRHPNILQLMAFATELSKLYLVMEFVEGNNLDDLLFGSEIEGSIMSIPMKMSVAEKICQAVAYLHHQKPIILHRDIKPENILLSRDFQCVKLCDMGMCKLKTMTTLITTMAGCNSLQPGTPAYQAPELLIDKKSASTSSDIWSLSLTLLELICELPAWNFQENDCIDYIIEKMKIRAHPDVMLVLLDRADISASIVDALRDGLHYSYYERPTALDLLKAVRS